MADRRRIATGLAKGQGPAAIARSLGRATSTVTREIARGGGPDGYRAADAQRSAQRRARRSRPRDVPAPRVWSAGTAAAAVELEADFARVAEETGLQRSAARVLACLLVDPSGRRTARELAEHLGLSAGSISGAVRYLDGQGLVIRRTEGRRHVYVVDETMWTRTWEASLRTNGQWVAICRRGADLLGTGTVQGARLESAWRFLSLLQRELLLAGRKAGFVNPGARG